jgi:UDP-N-acetyl-2-amino-2-deoxyglucuronate dehydrogenase
MAGPRDKVRLGIIGCGGIARGRHLTGLTALQRAGLDNFEVTALCDTVEENLDAAADYLEKEQGVRPERFTSWEDCVSRAPVDAVDICLPHGLHHVTGIAALEAGLHVVMEKPYTVTVKTGRQLAEAADRSGKVLATAVPHRRMPGQRAVWWAINEGRLLGEPRMFLANYTQYRPQPAQSGPVRPSVSWRRDRMMGGGSGVIDSGFHFLDTLLYFFGECEQVYAELRAFGANKDGSSPPGGAARGQQIVDQRENTAVVTFTFKNGVVGTWCWSFQVAGHETRNIVFYGGDGSIEDTGYSDRFVIYHLFMHQGEFRGRDGSYLSMGELQARMRREVGPDRVQQWFPNGVTDHFAVELWDFLDAVEKGRKPEVDGWGGLATTALVEAIYESAMSGQSVRLADVLSGAAYHGWQKDIDDHWAAQPIPKLTRA